jgi:hypothetical protein
MTESIIVSEPGKRPTVASRHTGDAGGVVLRHSQSFIILSRDELARVVAFVAQ